VPRIPVFLSFDVDFDNDCRALFAKYAESAEIPFEIADWSIREMASDWREKVRTRIARVEVVIVFCGEHTRTAPGVNAEIAFAREVRTPYVLIDGRSDGGSTKPTTADVSHKVHDWTWRSIPSLIEAARLDHLERLRG
jgi:arginase family enzyme